MHKIALSTHHVRLILDALKAVSPAGESEVAGLASHLTVKTGIEPDWVNVGRLGHQAYRAAKEVLEGR